MLQVREEVKVHGAGYDEQWSGKQSPWRRQSGELNYFYMTNTIKFNKFGVSSYDNEFICSLAEQYTRGLCWVLGYYYQVGMYMCVQYA